MRIRFERETLGVLHVVARARWQGADMLTEPWTEEDWTRCAHSAKTLCQDKGYWRPFSMARWYARQVLKHIDLLVKGKRRNTHKWGNAVAAIRFFSDPAAMEDPEVYTHVEHRIIGRWDWVTPEERKLKEAQDGPASEAI